MFMPKAPTLTLNDGDRAPAFHAVSHHGHQLDLADLKGKHVALYFYPKDDTPGCTKEACAFRDEFAALQKKGRHRHRSER